ncbi:MAG: hypothetical protein SGI94_05490, partial [Saprospiraceae bacterium]|nr:hypothetical protein [Saprospiraceae bacterium]
IFFGKRDEYCLSLVRGFKFYHTSVPDGVSKLLDNLFLFTKKHQNFKLIKESNTVIKTHKNGISHPEFSGWLMPIRTMQHDLLSLDHYFP